MGGMKEIKRVSAGVMFESDVLKYIDRIAAEQQRNRSFIINRIIRQYARVVIQQIGNTSPEPEKAPVEIHF